MKNISIKNLFENDFFGAISFFTNNIRSMSIRSKDFTTLLKINRQDFINLLK